MGKNKKPRKKYRQKSVLQNPIGYVLEGMTLVEQAASDKITMIKIKNHAAMVALVKGAAKKSDMGVIVTMSNVSEALLELGFGREYQNVCTEGEEAIYSIMLRAQKHGRFTPTGPEIQRLNALLELHESQLSVVTVKDLEDAYLLVKKRLATGFGVTKLPPVPENLK